MLQPAERTRTSRRGAATAPGHAGRDPDRHADADARRPRPRRPRRRQPAPTARRRPSRRRPVTPAPTPTPTVTATPAAGPVGGGQVGLLLISPLVKPNSSYDLGSFNHYSLLRSIEDLFALQHLGYAAGDEVPGFDEAVYNGG